MLKGSGEVLVRFAELDVGELTALDADARATLQFLDVRTPREWTGPLGCVVGADLLPLQEFFFRGPPPSLDPARPVVVICRSGVRSASAALLLAAIGYSEVFNLLGGMIAWNQAGLPVAPQ